MTTPVVPRIDSPPTMPRRPLVVRAASTSPPGIASVTSRSPASPRSRAISATRCPISLRGPGLIAGSPTDRGNPGRVTTPTPSPAMNSTPEPASPRQTEARIRAPSVTSGSSPASLITAAVARGGRNDRSARSNTGRSPRGNRIDTGSGKRPVRSAMYAALVAAAAQAPVVQPRRSSPSGLRPIVLPPVPRAGFIWPTGSGYAAADHS